MKIQHDFEYDAYYYEIADEFCKNNSEYQANVLNTIGAQLKIWSQDKEKLTYFQILEISEQLDDNGKWFVKLLYDYMIEPQESGG